MKKDGALKLLKKDRAFKLLIAFASLRDRCEQSFVRVNASGISGHVKLAFTQIIKDYIRSAIKCLVESQEIHHQTVSNPNDPAEIEKLAEREAELRAKVDGCLAEIRIAVESVDGLPGPTDVESRETINLFWEQILKFSTLEIQGHHARLKMIKDMAKMGESERAAFTQAINLSKDDDADFARAMSASLSHIPEGSETFDEQMARAITESMEPPVPT